MNLENQYPIGLKIDFDGSFGYQCFDFGNQYHFDLTGLRPKIQLLRACDIWYQPDGFFADGVEYERIPNTPDNFPIYGDIIIWNENTGGGFGHVAVILDANVTNFRVREQDGFTQKGIQETLYPTYRNVLGWYRIKSPIANNSTNQISKPQPDWVKFEKICGLDHTIYFQNIVNDNNWPLAINDYADRVAEKNFEISLRADAEEMIKMCLAKIQNLETENENLKKDWAVLDKQGSDARAENQKLKSEIENLKNQTQIEIIKNPDSTNQSQKVFDLVNDITAQINTKIEPNKKDNQNTANKPFWQSKKFASLVLSTGIGALAVYFKVDNLDTVLSTIASIEMMYLGSQGLVDSGLVKQIVNNFKK